MNEARLNPQAMAKAQNKQLVRATDLGDGVALVGFELQPMLPVAAEGEEATVAVGIFAIGGRSSPLSLNVELRAVFISELGRMPIANLKRMLSEDPRAALAPQEEAAPQ